MQKDKTDFILEQYKQFWDSTASIYSNAKLTTEGGEDLEVVLSKTKNIDNLVCLGVATGCRDPLFLLNAGLEPNKLMVNDLSPELLKICLNNLSQYSGVDKISFVGPVHSILENSAQRIRTFLSAIEPVLCVGVYRKEAFYNKFNGYSALELYSEERKNIGSDCSVFPIFHEKKILKRLGKGANFRLPLISNQIDQIRDYLHPYEELSGFGGFQFNSIKEGNPFVSHYYTRGLLEQMFLEIFPNHTISVTDTKTRNYVIFVKRKDSEPNTMITMINNVLGNIPNYLQKRTLKSIKDTFYIK